MKIRNYYIHHGDRYKEINTNNFKVTRINNILEHLLHYKNQDIHTQMMRLLF